MATTRRRIQPLKAPQHDNLSGAAAEAEAEMAELAHGVVVGGGVATPGSNDPHAEAKRVQRLADGVRGLRAGGAKSLLRERTLMVVAGVLAPLGLVLILVGWNGASHTPNLYEQVPYAISGGLFGLGLLFLGSFFYFAHWITELVKEHRAQSAAIVDAIGRLEEAIRVSSVTATATATAPAAASVPAVNGMALVATDKGTMAHRPDCVVVVGKAGIRAVTVADGLEPCKLCDPYATSTNERPSVGRPRLRPRARRIEP